MWDSYDLLTHFDFAVRREKKLFQFSLIQKFKSVAGESQLFFGLFLAKGGGMSPAYSWVYIKENYGTILVPT